MRFESRLSSSCILAFVIGLSGSACVQRNASHCANNEGSKTCEKLYGDARPVCSICTADHEGCVKNEDELVKGESSCHVATEGDTLAGTGSGTGTDPTVASAETTATTPGTTMITMSSDSMSGGESTTGSTEGGESSSSGGGPVCGDGMIEGEERCDGAEVDGESCESLKLGGGTLACDPVSCTFDVSGCDTQPSCENEVIEGNEECSGANLDEQDCVSLGFAVGTLGCDPVSCQFDTAACSYCGDAVITGTDECDGEDLGDADCYAFGLDGGLLTCTAECTFDTAMCSPCGNGDLDANEQCDGGAFGGQDCVTAGYGEGTILCTEHCLYDFSMCEPADGCGNGELDEGEDCDESVNGVTCNDVAPIYGSSDGVLMCNDNCSFNVSGCCQGALAGCASNSDCCSNSCLLGGLLGLVCVGD